MVAVKPEVDIAQALYEIDMKFQRISRHFQDAFMTGHAATVGRLLLHQKSNMVAMKPEIVIILALCQIDTHFPAADICFHDGQ